MMLSNKILLTLLIVFLLNFPAVASSRDNSNYIDWSSFNLSLRQINQIRVYDNDWKIRSSILKSDLIKYQKRLKYLFSDPNAKNSDIRELQWQIFVKQQQLQYEALENFLNKRQVLSYEQRVRLHQILTK